MNCQMWNETFNILERETALFLPRRNSSAYETNNFRFEAKQSSGRRLYTAVHLNPAKRCHFSNVGRREKSTRKVVFQSWIRFNAASNEHNGIWGAEDEAVLNNVHKKSNLFLKNLKNCHAIAKLSKRCCRVYYYGRIQKPSILGQGVKKRFCLRFIHEEQKITLHSPVFLLRCRILDLDKITGYFYVSSMKCSK